VEVGAGNIKIEKLIRAGGKLVQACPYIKTSNDLVDLKVVHRRKK
jgi:hypothetical protein